MNGGAYERLSMAGRSVIVTGGGSGIGREVSMLLAARGASVTVADRNRNGADATAAAIRDSGGHAQSVHVDVSDEPEVGRLVQCALSAFGRLDAAFNNAGIGTPEKRPLAEIKSADWDRVIAVNLRGVFLCTKYVIEHMAAHGGGAIVNTASTAGQVAVGNTSPYVASKHGVVGITRAAAVDYARSGIRVNAVLPGVIRTPLGANALADPDMARNVGDAHPMGRIGEAHEVAEVVAFLLSDAASFMTGAAVSVDGGWTAT